MPPTSARSTKKKLKDIIIPDWLYDIIIWSRLVGWTPEDFADYVLRGSNLPVLDADVKQKINHSLGRTIDRAIETRRTGGSPSTPTLSRDFDIRDYIKPISNRVSSLSTISLCCV